MIFARCAAKAEAGERMMARASRVFNAAQVEGFEVVAEDLPEEPTFDPIQRAEDFARTTGAQIEEGGDKACFIPSLDVIRMPERRRFTGTETTTPAEGFYSTLAHELVHNAALQIMPQLFGQGPVSYGSCRFSAA
ncbi:MAG: hypothetical protein GVY36_20380 [Verrucomicrobia bacterium]|jgi:antirestriction protein ArdC|nr:hypothetical protein [Verrucomicrobiota bacterium]